MPASTRSSTKQAKLEDVGAGAKSSSDPGTKPTKSAPKTAQAGKKRKADAAPEDDSKKSAKEAKKSSNAEEADSSDVIAINRAPVLELWASCVARAMYPSISWETCLSAGGAISTITAISKGRSIGTMEKPDGREEQEKRQKRKEQADKEDLDELEVMSFHLRLKDGQAMVGDKPKKAGEDALRKKYGGDEQYDKVKKVFEEALSKWKGKEDELDKSAFHMYEDFRPSVQPGQAGWGRKGQLRLDTIREVVREGS